MLCFSAMMVCQWHGLSSMYMFFLNMNMPKGKHPYLKLPCLALLSPFTGKRIGIDSRL